MRRRALARAGVLPVACAAALLLGPIRSPAAAQAAAQAAVGDPSAAAEAAFERRVSPEGRLLASSPAGADWTAAGDDTPASGELRSGGGVVAWERAGPELFIRAYDAAGRLVSSRSYREGKLVAEESRERDERGETVRYREPAAERLTVERYEGGRIISRESFVKGAAAGRSSFSYDQAGRLIREDRVSAAGATIELSYSYAQDGFLERDEERRGQNLVLARSYARDGSRVEERYDGGRLVVRTRYEENRRVAEELYQGGALVRERRF